MSEGNIYKSVTPDSLCQSDNVDPTGVEVCQAHNTWVRAILCDTRVIIKGQIPTGPDKEYEGGVQ